MKKILGALALVAFVGSANAANFIELSYDNVNADPSSKDGTAQTIRAGKDAAGLNFGLQVKTRTIDSGGIKNTVEVNVGKEFNLAGIVVKPFAGVGHDNGTGSTGSGFEYGLVGLAAGTKVSVFNVGALVKNRINWQNNTPEQTVVNAFVGYPITKDFEARVNIGQSFRDIKEKTIGGALVVRF